MSICILAMAAISITGGLGIPDDRAVTVACTPSSPYVENMKHSQHLSVDFILTNQGSKPLRISRVEVSVFDKSDRLVMRRFNENGLSAVLQSTAIVPPGKSVLLLNPFPLFDASLSLSRLTFDFTLVDEESDREYKTRAEVRPRTYLQKTRLTLPLDGRILVYVGHDFYAHHRRVDLTHPMVKQLGVTTNPTRFASDFCVVDEAGKLFRTDGRTNEDWFGWGAPVLAPAAGRVVAARNDVDDNIFGKSEFDPALALADIHNFLGNYVAIEHRSGEVSVFAHLRKGSVPVSKGQMVVGGEQIGRMGRSGDSEYVHLHYQSQERFETNSETLPVAFSDYDWLLGTKRVRVRQGVPETGEIIRSSARK